MIDFYFIIYTILFKILLENLFKERKLQKTKRSLILIGIPYIILYKTLLKPIKHKKTLEVKETPNSDYDSLYCFVQNPFSKFI